MTISKDAEARLQDASRRRKQLKALKRSVAKTEAVDERLIERSRLLLAESWALRVTEE